MATTNEIPGKGEGVIPRRQHLTGSGLPDQLHELGDPWDVIAQAVAAWVAAKRRAAEREDEAAEGGQRAKDPVPAKHQADDAVIVADDHNDWLESDRDSDNTEAPEYRMMAERALGERDAARTECDRLRSKLGELAQRLWPRNAGRQQPRSALACWAASGRRRRRQVR